MRRRMPVFVLGLILIGAGLVAMVTVHVVNPTPLFVLMGAGVVLVLLGIVLGGK